MAKGATKKPHGPRAVAQNRKARHDYDILDTFECGIQLVGSEVKSLRDAQVQMRDAFARVENDEVWMYGVHIAPYAFAQTHTGHDPDRRRKLLLHRREIEELRVRTQQEGLTLVPLSIYFREGKAKVDLGVGRGRKLYDKRAAIAKRDAEREADRGVARRRRGEE
ncbi:MAG TPA: SsrA-binding protein SmpB [Acidimicrobiales bacterium]|nr:SsrA-binding protein SmpB [Acidimicrobiales bacterium]